LTRESPRGPREIKIGSRAVGFVIARGAENYNPAVAEHAHLLNAQISSNAEPPARQSRLQRNTSLANNIVLGFFDELHDLCDVFDLAHFSSLGPREHLRICLISTKIKPL
jgi:hypothetical protein